jgi:hypothetical protein
MKPLESHSAISTTAPRVRPPQHEDKPLSHHKEPMNNAYTEGATSAIAPSTVNSNSTSARLEQFYAVMEQHRAIVRKGIWSIVRHCADLGLDHQTVRSIEAQVWMKVFLELPKWLAPGYSNDPARPPASLGTRLYAAARMQALGWRTDQLRYRQKFMQLSVLEEIIRRRERREEAGYRSLKHKYPVSRLDGSWNFDEVDPALEAEAADFDEVDSELEEAA